MLGPQFRQRNLWNDPDGEVPGLSRAHQQLRERSAVRMWQPWSEETEEPHPDFVGAMGRAKTTLSDMHALEHVSPTIDMESWTTSSMGAYDPYAHHIEISPHQSEDDLHRSLYHELGHAIHVGGVRAVSPGASAWHNPDPLQEGYADGFSTRLMGLRGGEAGYRDTDHYQAEGSDDIEPQAWGLHGRQLYETTRAAAEAGGHPPRAIGAPLFRPVPPDVHPQLPGTEKY